MFKDVFYLQAPWRACRTHSLVEAQQVIEVEALDVWQPCYRIHGDWPHLALLGMSLDQFASQSDVAGFPAFINKIVCFNRKGYVKRKTRNKYKEFKQYDRYSITWITPWNN